MQVPVPPPGVVHRIDAQELFSFRCRPGGSCFTKCCHELELALTPYDVLRLRWATGLSSSEVQRLREVFAAAEAKAATDAVAAGDEASKAIQNPAAVAHHAAELAVDYYLRAGHRQAATSAALKGLQYKTSTASWALAGSADDRSSARAPGSIVRVLSGAGRPFTTRRSEMRFHPCETR